MDRLIKLFRTSSFEFGLRLRDFISDESGQGSLEYILILSGSVLMVGQLVRVILKAFDAGMLRFGGQLERDLKVGRAPLGVWEN